MAPFEVLSEPAYKFGHSEVTYRLVNIFDYIRN